MKLSKSTLLGITAALLMTGCSELQSLQTDAQYKDKNRDDLYKNGSVISDKGGFSLFDSDDVAKKARESGGIGVNGYLWRATLDTLAFMPMQSADPFGGIVITDWYSPPQTPNERTKLNVYIRDRDLRADGVKVSVFRQIRDLKGTWTDASVAADTSSSLENAILTKARQLRMLQKQQKE